ncbi:DUF1996 domain-containing protein [Lacimicrobium sp. SS2-24]|uniref:DUF1996 domain-containing protein n=1 Tax=Lacimicrobium sp. SS2-24 TaxID=2005569 RepID=UPI000B4B9A94|nr:DUF1996 domain-containing protein [Lacimicrobium sp. SS2-24]
MELHKTLFISVISLSVLSACGGGSESETETTTTVATATTQTASTAPTSPEFSATPSATTQQSFATFSFNTDAAYTYECQLDDQAIGTCESPVTLLLIEAGSHQFQVWAVDSSGNRSEPAAYQWSVNSIFTTSEAHSELIPTTVEPSSVAEGSWRGIYRINCDFSHSSYNDPIVFPGQENAAHLHRFYGNTLVDHTTTMASLYTEGESSCQGNTLNLSSYWVPALLAPKYDENSGERIYDDNGEPAWQVVPAVVGNDDEAHEVFYYSAGIDDLDAIQPVPAGLRMIAGDHMGQPGMAQDTSIVRWHCQSWESDDAENPQFSASIPECIAPDRLRMDIFFPSCWNGVDLDSDDHKSHMAYPVNEGGPNGTQCPASHPVPIVRPSYHYAFGVKPEVYDPQSRSSKGWKLAADMYEVSENSPGGMSLHGDWFNGWHPEAMQALLDNCIKGELDCHDGNLANGYRLSGTRPGPQTEPEIINGGLGYD